MATSYGQMSSEEKNGLVQSLAECITKHGFENEIKITKSRETVCALAQKSIEDNQVLKIEKQFSPDRKAAVEAFKEDAQKIIEGISEVSLKVESVIKVGCQYDPISGIVPIKGGDPITLEHVPGEVWLIDFWATWCPPCQAPMAHNETMLANNGAKWGDKVKIIGISIDQTADAVVKHIEAKDWKRPIHYHRAQSKCSEVYQVRGVPHVMLLDTTGKIVFKGHPAGRPNLEEDFNTLLEGGTIKVEGEEEEDEAKEEDAAGAEGKDPVASMAYIEKFKNELAPGLQKNEKVAAVAKNMPRAFCVMVYEEHYNVAKAKSTIDWKNYRVLVGPKEALETVKTALDEALDKASGFEIVLREHPTD